MKIIVIGPYFPFRGGIADTNQELCNALLKSGHSVEILNFKLQYPSVLFPGKTQLSKQTSGKIIDSKKNINSINLLNWFKCAKKINDLNPDIVISSYWTSFMSPCLSIINRNLKKKIIKIGIIHNAYPHEKILLQKYFFKFYLNSITKYYTLSKNVFEQIKLINKEKKGIELFHPIPKKFGEPVSVEIAKEKAGLNKSFKYLLFFGVIREYKGLDVLIKAMKKVVKHDNKIKLLVIGENYESIEKYKNLAIKENVYDNIHFNNEFVNDDEIKYWFCSAKLIIQPYKSASQSGITPLAIQFEIPTVCSNIKGLSEYITESKDGFLSNPNPRDLANKIIFALNFDLDLIKKELSTKKKKYSWNNFTNKLIQKND